MIHSILEWRKASAGEQTTAPVTETRVESLYLRDGEEPAEESEAVSAEEEEEKSGAVSGEEEEEEKKSGAVSAEEEETRAASAEEDEEEEKKSGAMSAEEEEKSGAASAEEPLEESGAVSAEEEDDGVTAGRTQTNTQQPPLLGLVLTPTRELAVQVQHHIDAVARFTGQCALTNTYHSQC